MNDELDHIMGALRGPATSDELAGETAVVDRMYHAHQSKGPTMFTSRRTRVATLIAAGVLGFGSVAAAGPVALEILTDDTQTQDEEEVLPPAPDGEQDDAVPTPPAPEPEPEPEPAPAPEPLPEGDDDEIVPDAQEAVEADEVVDEDPAPMPELLDDPATTFFDESQCLPGNHGKTVSAVARGDFDYYERDKDTGKLTEVELDVEVRDAARSSCGKDFEGVDPEEDVDLDEDLEEELEAEQLEVEEIDEPESKGKPDHAGGKDKGKPDHAGGKDKGKGKGKSGRG